METPVFTKQVVEALTDDQYGLLQGSLVTRPDAGDLIRGSGGIRKLRWALPGRGKRGGIRVIHFLASLGIPNPHADDVREE